MLDDMLAAKMKPPRIACRDPGRLYLMVCFFVERCRLWTVSEAAVAGDIAIA